MSCCPGIYLERRNGYLGSEQRFCLHWLAYYAFLTNKYFDLLGTKMTLSFFICFQAGMVTNLTI